MAEGDAGDEQARATAREALDLLEAIPDLHELDREVAVVAESLARLGMDDEARVCIAPLSDYDRDAHAITTIAVIHAERGEFDVAWEWLQSEADNWRMSEGAGKWPQPTCGVGTSRRADEVLRRVEARLGLVARGEADRRRSRRGLCERGRRGLRPGLASSPR